MDFHTQLQNIPIFVKTYELYKIFYEYLSSFPRKDRFVLGQRCETILLEILEAVVLASSVSKQEKLTYLKASSAKIDILKVLFMLGKDLKIIDNKKYLVLDSLLSEIGRMFGGWIKSTTL